MGVMVGTGDDDGERLEAELAVVCGQLNQVSARLVALTARAIECEGWAGSGIRSVEHWLVLRAGLSPGRAAAVVLMARRSGVLPVVMGAFAAGRLSVDQVAVVARHAPAHVEASVAELAVSASVPQLGRVLSRYSFDPPTGEDPGTDAEPVSGPDSGSGSERNSKSLPDLVAGAVALEPPLEEVGRAGAAAELSMCIREGGRFELRFSAPADVGALVQAAVSEARDALFGSGVSGVTGADALVQVCTRSLGTVVSRSRQDAFRVYVHLDAEGGWLNGRPRLPGHLVARLTCAGIVQPLWKVGGVPVSVGRALRIVPERTRRLVLDRDRGCRFPGCVATAHLEVHHVVHWADGGRTDLGNLVAVCSFHHDAHHRGEFSLTGDANVAGDLVFLARGRFPIGPGPTYIPVPAQARTAPTPRSSSSSGTGSGSESGSESESRIGRGVGAGAESMPGSGPQVCTIGVSTSDPDGLDPGHDLNESGDLEGLDNLDDRGDPDEGADDYPQDEHELWPGAGPPVAYPGATGEVLHSKWVTFHEGPALLL
jgi:hypothetical protein